MEYTVTNLCLWCLLWLIHIIVDNTENYTASSQSLFSTHKHGHLITFSVYIILCISKRNTFLKINKCICIQEEHKNMLTFCYLTVYFEKFWIDRILIIWKNHSVFFWNVNHIWRAWFSNFDFYGSVWKSKNSRRYHIKITKLIYVSSLVLVLKKILTTILLFLGSGRP